MDISDSPEKGHNFCKIVLSKISLHDKLMILGKFVRKYRKYLGVRVYLKASTGEVWPVDLVAYSSELWLQKGRPEFTSFYSLRFGNFLVFKYKGNSYFKVFMYEKSGIETDYTLASTATNMDEQHNLNLGQSTQMEKRKMSDINELKACKKTGANSSCIESCHIGECLMRRLHDQKIAKVTSDRALEVTLDDNIEPLDKLNSKFANGNSLCVGDVCMFELIDQAQMLLKVFIHRATTS